MKEAIEPQERGKMGEGRKMELKVGQIIYVEWGHDETIVTFYRVLDVDGEMITVAEMSSDIKGNGTNNCLNATATPLLELSQKGKITRRIKDDYLRIGYGFARVWDGNPVPCSCEWR